MSYFKTSYETLQRLASQGRYDDVAGFLVLARHASGNTEGGYAPYKLSGAGVNSIHDKVGVSEETARGIVQRLQQAGVIQPASAEAKTAFFRARWEVIQGPLDLDLPHAITDPLKKKTAAADSALARVRAAVVHPDHAQALNDISEADVRLDVLMLLLSIYRHTDMHAYGGLSPHCAYRQWDVKSQAPQDGGTRWGAEPEENRAYRQFMQASLAHVTVRPDVPQDLQMLKDRFWNAFQHIKDSGLVYEAVCQFTGDPAQHDWPGLVMTLRVNDYHAGSSYKNGDPSFLRSADGHSLGYYTQAINDRDDPEAMWVVLPEPDGALVGIWRPRFRASSPNVGRWIEGEDLMIERALEVVLEGEADAASDDF